MSSSGADCDVAVVGAGPAGIAAALAASACGARTVLLESDADLGGNVSQAFVHTICGLYLPSSEHVPVHAHAGLPRAFAEALQACGGAGNIGWAGAAGFLHIDPHAFAALASASCGRSELLEVHAGMRVAGVHLARSHELPTTLRMEVVSDTTNASGASLLTARAVVDASGDATVAALGGARTEQAPAAQLQHASYIFRIDGVDAAALDGMERARTAAAVAHAARHGELPAHAASIALRGGLPGHSVFVTVNLPKPVRFDPLDAFVLSQMDVEARDAARALLGWLIARRPPFSSARLGGEPARIGIRETRRVTGIARVELDDVLSGRRRDDEACLSTWPVELWDRSNRLTFRAGAGPCSIPLGALVADHPGRLAMAGRCASASHEALGAVRVIATSMAMGEAAGVACALAVRNGRPLAEVGAADVRSVVASGVTSSALPRDGSCESPR